MDPQLQVAPVILRHLQLASFLDHILEVAETHDQFFTIAVQQGHVFACTPQQESTLDLPNGDSSLEQGIGKFLVRRSKRARDTPPTSHQALDLCDVACPVLCCCFFSSFLVWPECIADFDVTRVVLIGGALNAADLLPLQFLQIDNDGAAAAADCPCHVSVGNPHLPSSAVLVKAKIDEKPKSTIR